MAQRNVADVLESLGFWVLTWQILTYSELVVGGHRRGHHELIELKSALYAAHGKRELLKY